MGWPLVSIRFVLYPSKELVQADWWSRI